MQKQESGLAARPRFWCRLSIWAGNALQVGGILLGIGIVHVAGHTSLNIVVQTILMLAGSLMVYVCCHSLAHWLIGRLVGIEFQGYGLRGTDEPRRHPPVARQLMTVFPVFTAITRKASMERASPLAKAVMFAAGESSTAICSLWIAWYAWQLGLPTPIVLLWGAAVFNLITSNLTLQASHGDFAKAWEALRKTRPGRM